MLAEEKTAQMRVLLPGIAEGVVGTIFWAAPTRARYLIEGNAAALVNLGCLPSEAGRVLQRSPNWPLDRFSEVLPLWGGATVAILGGGASLTLQQIAVVHQAHRTGQVLVIAVNDAYLLAPWADILYAADSLWWQWHQAGVPRPKIGLSAAQVRERFTAFAGQRCSIQNTGLNVCDPAVHLLRNFNFPVHGYGLSRDPKRLVTGRNSGFQALNLAVLAGATEVLLLGFDALAPRNGEESHWFGEHPRPTPMAAYEEYRRAFSAAESEIRAAGVRVVNCSPGSVINSFEKQPLEQALGVALRNLN